MQTLGLADAGERSDSRLKSLFWPSVQSGADVDYLGAQGYWICAFIAAVSFGFSLLQGSPFLAITLLLFSISGALEFGSAIRWPQAWFSCSMQSTL